VGRFVVNIGLHILSREEVNTLIEAAPTPFQRTGSVRSYTFGRLWIQIIVDIVEIYKGEMFNIEKGEIKRANVEHGATEVGLRVSLPGNTCILKKSDQMLVCG
jgi:hypothetical protein